MSHTGYHKPVVACENCGHFFFAWVGFYVKQLPYTWSNSAEVVKKPQRTERQASETGVSTCNLLLYHELMNEVHRVHTGDKAISPPPHHLNL